MFRCLISRFFQYVLTRRNLLSIDSHLLMNTCTDIEKKRKYAEEREERQQEQAQAKKKRKKADVKGAKPRKKPEGKNKRPPPNLEGPGKKKFRKNSPPYVTPGSGKLLIDVSQHDLTPPHSYSFSIVNLVQKKQEYQARAQSGKPRDVIDMVDTSSDSSLPPSRSIRTLKKKNNQQATSPSDKKKSKGKSSVTPQEASGIEEDYLDEIANSMYDLYYKGQKSGDLKELLDHLGPTKWPAAQKVVLSSGAMVALRRYESAVKFIKEQNYSDIPGIVDIVQQEKKHVTEFLRDLQQRIDDLEEQELSQSGSSDEESSSPSQEVSPPGRGSKLAKTGRRSKGVKTSKTMKNLTNCLPSGFPKCYLPFFDQQQKGSIALIDWFHSVNEVLKTGCKTGFRFWNPIIEEFSDMKGRYDQQQLDSFLHRSHGIDVRGQVVDQKKNDPKKKSNQKKSAKEENKSDGDLKEYWAKKTSYRREFVAELDLKTHSHYCVLQEDLARFNCWCLPPSVGKSF